MRLTRRCRRTRQAVTLLAFRKGRATLPLPLSLSLGGKQGSGPTDRISCLKWLPGRGKSVSEST